MRTISLASILLGLSACTSSTSEATDVATGAASMEPPESRAVITFGPAGSEGLYPGDGSVSTSAPLVSGATATIDYELARLDAPTAAEIRECAAGDPVIVPHVTVDHSDVGDLARQVATSTTSVRFQLIVPSGKELEVWFEVNGADRQCGYDSNQSNNYVFPIMRKAPP